MAEIKERPILFSAPMVRAILDGRKTQTRRAVKGLRWIENTAPGVEPYWFFPDHPRKQNSGGGGIGPHHAAMCPYGRPGDRLWVRETARCNYRGETPPKDKGTIGVEYQAGGPGKMQPYALADRDLYPWFPNLSHNARGDMRWAPSIHMPRWASRILLEIESVRVERLQDISEADALAEGTPCYVCGGALDGRSDDDCHCFHRKATASDYRNLWEQINGPGSWDANPWIWAISFQRIEA